VKRKLIRGHGFSPLFSGLYFPAERAVAPVSLTRYVSQGGRRTS
jgi:hypothetical protein